MGLVSHLYKQNIRGAACWKAECASNLVCHCAVNTMIQNHMTPNCSEIRTDHTSSADICTPMAL